MSDRNEQDDRRRAQFREAILLAFYERGDRIAELEGEIAEHEEHLRSAMLGIGGADEAPCSRCLPLQAEVVRQGARITELEAQLQSFRDFNAPLLRAVAEEEPGAWDHLQRDDNDE